MRLLERVGWLRLPDTKGGFTHDHLALARALCPHARVRLVDGQRLSWYGSRTAAGLRYMRELAST